MSGYEHTDHIDITNQEPNGVTAAEYQHFLNLPDDIKQDLIPTLNTLYINDLNNQNEELQKDFAQGIQATYAIDLIQSESTTTLLDQIKNSQGETGEKVSIEDIIALGKEVEALLLEKDLDLDELIRYITNDLKSVYTDTQRKSVREFRRTGNDQAHTMYTKQYDLPSDHKQMKRANKRMQDVTSDLQDLHLAPSVDTNSKNASSEVQDKESSEQESHIDQETHDSNVSKVNDKLGILDNELTIEKITERSQSVIKDQLKKSFMTIMESKEFFKNMGLLETSDKQVYVEQLLSSDAMTGMIETLAHEGLRFTTQLIKDQLKPGLNPEDALNTRVGLLSRLNVVGSGKISQDILKQLPGVDITRLQGVLTNTQTLISTMVTSLTTGDVFKSQKKKYLEESRNEGNRSIKDHKKSVSQAMATYISTTLGQSLDNHQLVRSFIQDSYQGKTINYEQTVANLISHKNDPNTQVDEQDTRQLVGQLAEITDMLPAGIESEATQELLREKFVNQKATQFLDTKEGEMVAGLLDGMFDRERLAQEGFLQSIVKLMYDFFGVDIPLDEIHDVVDAGQTTKEYAKMEKKYPVKKVKVENDTTSFDYDGNEPAELKGVGSSTDAVTTSYRLSGKDVWIQKDEDGILSYHKQLTDGTTQPVDDLASENIFAYCSISEAILQDFNPLAFLKAAGSARNGSYLYSERSREEYIKRITTKSGDSSNGKLNEKETKLLFNDLGPHIATIIEEQLYLHTQEDLVSALMIRIQKDGWFEPMTIPDEANPDEVNPDEVNPDEVNPDEVNPDEVNPDEVNPDEVNPDEVNPDEVNPDE